jgi:serine/threonine-protein kinase
VGLALAGLVGLGILLGVASWEPQEVRDTSVQPAEVDARNEGRAYLSLSSSLDVRVTIDGVPVEAPLPLVRYPVKPGYRRIEVETLDRTRQRKVFEVHFGRGQHRQLEPLFQP